MKRRRHTAPALSAFLVLMVAGCSTGNHGTPDSAGVDLAPEAGLLHEGGEIPGDLVPGRSLTGRLVDEGGAPVPGAMLVLCGQNEGIELCNQQFSDDDGFFEYTGLSKGFDHLQILPYPSFHETGKPYCGLVLPIDLPLPGEPLDIGELRIPLAESTAPLNVADGGEVTHGPLTVQIPPGSISFPGLEDEAPFGIAEVPSDQVPFSYPGIVAAFSFHPFACGLTQPASVRYTPDGISPADVLLLTNSTITGALAPIESHVEEGALVAQSGELTWLIAAVQP
jgi:hypothetical protein